MCKSRERLSKLAVVPQPHHRERFFKEIFGTATVEDLVNGDDGDETLLVDVRVRVHV